MAKTVRYYIDVDAQGAVKGGRVAEEALKQVDQQSERTGVGTIALGNIFADVAGQIGNYLAQLPQQIIDVGANYEATLDRVAGISGATRLEQIQLSNAARELGASTKFSAVEAGEGMTFLAMAGYETDQVLEAMPGLLALSSAGNLELAESADIVSNILSGYNLEANETASVTDLIAKTATSSNTDVQQLGQGLKFVGPVASSLNIDLAETAAAMGFLGDAGLQGTIGGTSLRASLLQLTNPSESAQKVMDSLDIAVTNLDGSMKSLPEIIDNISSSTTHLTEQQRVQALGSIVGQEAVSGLIALLNRGGDELRAFSNELRESAGAAQNLSEVNIDNFAGDLQIAKSVADELRIVLFGTFDERLRAMVQSVTAATAEFSKWLSKISGQDLASQLDEERSAMNSLVYTITGLNQDNERRSELMQELVQQYPEFLGYISDEGASNEDLKVALEEINSLYIERAAVQIASQKAQEKLSAAGEALERQFEAERELMETLHIANEEFGLGLDLTTGSYQDRIEAAKEALLAEAEFRDTAKGNNVAMNDQARLYDTLQVEELKYAGLLQLVAARQREAGDAAAYRQAIEEALASNAGDGQTVKLGIEVDMPTPLVPAFENPDPIHLPIEIGEINVPDLHIDWEKAFLIPDGTFATLEKNLAKLDLMPDSTIANLQDKLATVQELYVNAQTDAERDRLAVVEEGIREELEAKEQGRSVEAIRTEEHYIHLNELTQEYADVSRSIITPLINLQLMAIQNEMDQSKIKHDKKIKEIDKELKSERISEKRKEQLLQKRYELEEQFEEKTSNLKRESFKKQKTSQIIQSVINTASAVVAALAPPPTGFGPLVGSIMAGVIGGMGAVQIGLIASQPNPYLTGGQVLERLPEGKSTPGMKMISINENGAPEYIINAASTERFQPILDLINYYPEEAAEILANMGATPEPFLTGGLTTNVGDVAAPEANPFNSVMINIPEFEGALADQVGAAVSEGLEAGFQNLSAELRLNLDELIVGIEQRQADRNRLGL